MLVNALGSVREVSRLHCVNAYSPMLIIVSGKVMEVSAVWHRNDLSPTLVMMFGSVTEVILGSSKQRNSLL